MIKFVLLSIKINKNILKLYLALSILNLVSFMVKSSFLGVNK